VQITPSAVDPGPGSTRITLSSWTTGYTYLDGQKQGMASTIWSSTLNIGGFFAKGVGAIITTILSFLGDPFAVDQNKGATARLLHSYYYPEKHAQVYTHNRVWSTYYTAQPRQWFKHEFASYVNTRGYTRTATQDFTPDNGYSAIRTDTTTHYNDHTWLMNEAAYRWRRGDNPGCESFERYCI